MTEELLAFNVRLCLSIACFTVRQACLHALIYHMAHECLLFPPFVASLLENCMDRPFAPPI